MCVWTRESREPRLRCGRNSGGGGGDGVTFHAPKIKGRTKGSTTSPGRRRLSNAYAKASFERSRRLRRRWLWSTTSRASGDGRMARAARFKHLRPDGGGGAFSIIYLFFFLSRQIQFAAAVSIIFTRSSVAGSARTVHPVCISRAILKSVRL